MYEVGDYIVHPGQGVCRVEEITAGPAATYQLLPVAQRHAMRISFPVAGEDRLRPVLSRDEAVRAIDLYPSIEVDDFSAKSSSLEEEHFKAEIRRGSCIDTMRIVKTFRARIAEVRSRNKKPPVAYERILKQASERSLAELAVALDTTVEDVKALLATREGEDLEAN
jgi:CarD family transcriptional regulator